MRIGIDLDNTLVCYDRLFPAIAMRLGMLPNDFKGNKQTTREALRANALGEEGWMRLQGQVYGRYMLAADIFPGVPDFLFAAKDHEVFIVSHKTQFGHFDEERHDLREAARQWLEEHQFFNPDVFSISPANVFFADDLDQKIAKITELKLDVFIDDLPKVFDHSNFPTDTEKLHFSQDGYATWADLSEHVFPNAKMEQDFNTIARRLCGDDGVSVDQALQGGNNCVMPISGTTPAKGLKLYNTNPFDTRDRLGAEAEALTFLNGVGETQVPKLFATSAEDGALVISWIDGDGVDTVHEDDLTQAIAFVERLKSYTSLDEAKDLPKAAEACIQQSELIKQVENRIKRLNVAGYLYPELERLVEDFLTPAFEEVTTEIGSPGMLQQSQQTLSPSDFGFHNAIRQPDGTLVFIDMEYFGWDDPVKLTADFLLHPGMSLSVNQRQRFCEEMVRIFEDSRFRHRLKRHYPIYALRWCTIILNPFIPKLQNNAEPDPELLRTRLTRAQQLYDRVFKTHGDFPYDI